MNNVLAQYLGRCLPKCMKNILPDLVQYEVIVGEALNKNFDCTVYDLGTCRDAENAFDRADKMWAKIEGDLAACLSKAK